MTIRISLFALFIAVFLPFNAVAQEQPQNEVLSAAQDFMKDLDKTGQRHFSVLFGNYNLIQVVESVRESVDEAIDGCADANPDMKDALETRYDQWDAALKPVMKEANANVDNMVIAQDYAEPNKIRSYLKMIDKARKDQAKQVKKVPVVTPEACQGLLEEMEETEARMVQLLKTTLISLPQSMQAEDEEARAKAEAKAAEEAAKQAEKEAAEAEKAKAEEAEESE